MNGIEWIVEAHGCSAAALADRGELQALFGAIISELALKPMAPAQWHQFPAPGGLTGLCLLAESHLTIHTFPEHGSLCLNLFCCKPRPEWRFESYMRDRFGAASVSVRRLERAYAAEATAAGSVR